MGGVVFGYGPAVRSDGSDLAYSAEPEVDPSGPPGEAVTVVARRWSTSSRTAAQACTDFRDGVSERLGVVSQKPADGAKGCMITADGGRVAVVVTPRGSGSVGADIAVTERRP